MVRKRKGFLQVNLSDIGPILLPAPTKAIVNNSCNYMPTTKIPQQRANSGVHVSTKVSPHIPSHVANAFFGPFLKSKGGRKSKRKVVKGNEKHKLDFGLSIVTINSPKLLSPIMELDVVPNSLPDEDIEVRSDDKNALKMWELSKQFGVSFEGEDSVMIKRIEDLEERDRIGFTNSNQGERQGSSLTKRGVKELIKSKDVDFIGFQETKLEECNVDFCVSLWGNNECEWDFIPSVGRSGGILSIWDKNKFQKVNSYIGTGFWLPMELGWMVSNMELRVDKGRWLLLWPDTSPWALNRDFFDHCPIVLKQRKVEKGLTPFRFNNCLLNHHSFVDLVSKSWCEDSCSGRKTFIVKEKLKVLKGKINVLNEDSFGCLDSKLGQLSLVIQELDIIGENSTLNSEQLCSLKNLMVDWWETANLNDSSTGKSVNRFQYQYDTSIIPVMQLYWSKPAKTGHTSRFSIEP
ncbi:hypothetical protein Lal_00038182 [Lupinus albus]|nr:hypothetical protein Lal_00038182 [Lupinus albus]